MKRRSCRYLCRDVLEKVVATYDHFNFTKIRSNTTLNSSLGLEGLILKGPKSVYEPAARHWLKIKKDYMQGNYRLYL